MLIVNLLQLDLEKRFKLSNLIRKSIQNLKEYIPGEQPSDKNLIKLNNAIDKRFILNWRKY